MPPQMNANNNNNMMPQQQQYNNNNTNKEDNTVITSNGHFQIDSNNCLPNPPINKIKQTKIAKINSKIRIYGGIIYLVITMQIFYS